MKNFLLPFYLTLFYLSAFGQARFRPDAFYLKASARADSLYRAQDYAQAASAYDTLFLGATGGASPYDWYRAACAWAAAGDAGKAFYYLNRAVTEGGWIDLPRLLSERSLRNLRKDPRWEPLMTEVRSNKQRAEAALYQPLTLELDSLCDRSRRQTKLLDSLQKEYGGASGPGDSLGKRIRREDSLNLKRVKAILATYGWVGPDQVGPRGASFIFQLILGADSLTLETSLRKMRAAVAEDRARAQDLAFLEDLVLCRQGQRQIYGTQIRKNERTGRMEALPMEDPAQVDQRRASAGLEPLETFLKTREMEERSSGTPP